MKRNFGSGDILIAAGLGITLVFLIIGFATGIGGLSGSFSWQHINSIILWLLVIGAGFIFFMSLKNVKLINVMYIFAGFMILIHIPNGFTAYACGNSALKFYVFVGALLVGAGAYIAQKGAGFISGCCDKKKD